MKCRILGSLVALALILPASIGHASSDKAMDAEINTIAEHWAAAKYLSASNDERSSRMDAISVEADQLVARYPGRAEPLIWSGILNSERASLTWGLSALNLATKARDILDKAMAMDPAALDAGAATSLGVLYYRVPSFPIGWGDKEKARAMLEWAMKTAPTSRDAYYFYADFLYNQGEYAKAKSVIMRGLQLPPHPERPIWDAKFPLVMRGLLQRIEAAM